MDRDKSDLEQLAAQNASLKRRLDELEDEFDRLHRTEKQKQELEEQLIEVQKMEAIGILAGGVAHDINNILGTIMALASVVKEETDIADPRYKDIEDILTATGKGRDVVSDLLGFAGKGKYRKEIFPLSSILHDVEARLRRTIPRNIAVVIDGAETRGNVEGDYGQLVRALINICNNAVVAMPQGGTLRFSLARSPISPSLVTHASEPAGEYLTLIITDTGAGMAEDTLARAFEPFFSTDPDNESKGLGLSMVYGTIKNHGGTVTLDSEMEKGTTVTVYLPVSQSQPVKPRDSQPVASKFPSHPPVALIIDDEPMLLKAATRLLETMGMEVITAPSGEAGIEIFTERSFELSVVILDLQMPSLDGEATFYELKDINDNVPIYLASGYTMNGQVQKLLNSGAAGFLTKPFDLQTIDQMFAGTESNN